MLIVFLFFLSSCVTQTYRPTVYEIESQDVNEIYSKFLTLSHKYGYTRGEYKNVYYFKNFPYEKEGVTFAACDQEREVIFINIDIWFQLIDVQKEMVMFHELGHCFLKKEHNEGKEECAARHDLMCDDMRYVKAEYLKDPSAFIENLFNH